MSLGPTFNVRITVVAAKSWSTLLTVALVAFAASGRSQSASVLGKITGIVTDGTTGAPLADVTVKLDLHQPGCEPCIALIDSPPNVLTGPDGKFEFVNVPPREYEVVAAKPTYANGGFGISKAEDFAKGFSVASGATVSGIGITLHRNAVIAGRVTDDTGAPVVGQIVSVMKRTASGELEPFRGDNVSMWARRLPLTDDQGRYFSYVPAGEYYAVVDVVRDSDRFAFSLKGRDVTRNSGFDSQFFPASASFPGAKPINVRPGEVRDDVNFRLTKSPVVIVSGRVERPSAAAPTDTLTVRLRLDNLPDGVEARVGTDGSSFEFPAVVAGDYELTVQFRESFFLASVARRLRITTSEFKTRFKVPTTDVRGLVVRMPPAPDVTHPPPSAGQGVTPMTSGSDFGSLQVQVVDDRGAAVPNARVDVRYVDYPLTIGMSVADDKGTAAFSNVPQRSVTVSAEKDGYVKSTYGQRMIFEKGIQVIMDAREPQHIRLSIERAALISGIVRNGQGEPIGEVVVAARRWTTESGQRVLKEARSVLTGPDGRYRFHGLSSGTYVVTATQAPLWNEEAARRLGNEDSVLRREDWFSTIPRSIDPNSSSGIDVRPGEQRSDVDIVLARRVMTTVDVEGRIELPKQFSIGPMTPTPRIVEYFDPFEVSAVDWANRSATLNADGRFRFRDVRPGKHLVHWSNSYTDSEQSLWVMADVDTRRGSVSNLSLKPVRGAQVSGRIVLKSRSPLPALNTLRVSLDRHNDVNFFEPFIEDVGADGRFSFARVPTGDYSIDEFSVNPPHRWRVESVMVNGVDALDFPFQVRSGRDVSNAIVTLTDLPTDVSGVVLDPAGARASGAVVALFAAERRYWTVESRRVMLAQADSQGRVSFSKLAAGNYLIAVVDDPPRFGDWDQRLLARLRPRGIPLKVVLGESKTVELRAR